MRLFRKLLPHRHHWYHLGYIGDWRCTGCPLTRPFVKGYKGTGL